jgi:hypothetical protein
MSRSPAYQVGLCIISRQYYGWAGSVIKNRRTRVGSTSAHAELCNMNDDLDQQSGSEYNKMYRVVRQEVGSANVKFDH